ncbi:PREDICTED: auxin-responsive protein IAA15 isoform X2 [Tarenaya hassleriana]|uniref:auxin-responsive protein IAA15 isoform X2 n=1 Tax=Tarenaya hassleriana TaxID=28532 RepID=UPI00053C4255|nr:PREDICTED: auxin-responsive protein IAA15 isoform X2 [Tarenaya hassleriana]
MSPEIGKGLPESGDLEVTELTLGLPGSSPISSDGGQKSGTKRRFLETVDLSLGNSVMNNDISSVTTTSPPPKAQVVGWPPVRRTRKLATEMVRKYVKVAADCAAYLRKVDLGTYDCYEQLLNALASMFPGLTISKVVEAEKSGVHREYVPTYQDKDGDWMLVGDVPWKMFVESCKRLRLMKSVDALGLAID